MAILQSKLVDLVRVAVTSTGTGSPITLGSAITGFLTLALGGVADGTQVSYGIRDGANSETGWGISGASGTTLTRNVDASTNSGSPISLSGAAELVITGIARDFRWVGSPGGRLSLTSGVPVQTADVTGATTVHYVPYVHNKTPWFIGLDIGTSLSLALDNNSGHTGYQQSGKLYDLFLVADAGVLRLGSSPAWSTTLVRGTGAGTTELDFTTYPGLPTNKNSITIRFGSAVGNTLTAGANTALCVGTMYASADGQCTCQFNPAGAVGGNNTLMGLYNFFNRERCFISNKDTTGTWTYGTATWRQSKASGNNQIRFIDGLQRSHLAAFFTQTIDCTASSGAVAGDLGINFDSAVAAPQLRGQILANFGSAYSVQNSVHVDAMSRPLLGLHTCVSMEFANAGVPTWVGLNGDQFYLLILSTEY